MRERTGTARPGLCLQHLCSQRPAEAEAAAPGPAQYRRACCTTQPLHSPSQLLWFSATAPGHEIQPLTWPLRQTGMGKPGPVLPSTGAHTWRATQQVSHAHLSLQLSPVKRNSGSTRCTRQISRSSSVLCTPSTGFSNPMVPAARLGPTCPCSSTKGPSSKELLSFSHPWASMWPQHGSGWGTQRAQQNHGPDPSQLSPR